MRVRPGLVRQKHRPAGSEIPVQIIHVFLIKRSEIIEDLPATIRPQAEFQKCVTIVGSTSASVESSVTRNNVDVSVWSTPGAAPASHIPPRDAFGVEINAAVGASVELSYASNHPWYLPKSQVEPNPIYILPATNTRAGRCNCRLGSKMIFPFRLPSPVPCTEGK